MRNKSDFKVSDFVRCFACGKLTKKSAAVSIDGRLYGSTCGRRALLFAGSPFVCSVCGSPRLVEDMVDFEICVACSEMM
jgi:hypothetical protein